MDRWWECLPTGRVAYLDGASPQALLLAMEPLPDGAPAVAVYDDPTPRASPAQIVAAILDQLEEVALDRFPAWLPEAEGMTAAGGAGLPAVRALARRLASTGPHFGPFLADLAQRALARDRTRSARFAAEVRAEGLARVLAASYRRTDAALVVRMPDSPSPEAQQALVAAGEWLAHRAGLAVWLTGPPPVAADWVATVPVRLPDGVAGLVSVPPKSADRSAQPTIHYPPIVGRPRMDSQAELALEAALAPHPWAAGREWNQVYQEHPLANRICPDLLWREARLVVEIDGPEHFTELTYAADRRRDDRLQAAGFTVLRFTNAQVLNDTQTVVSQIARILEQRRRGD
ncbi:MAG: DUF559 domain-containing protein [Micromonosporaceae bacterium]